MIVPELVNLQFPIVLLGLGIWHSMDVQILKK